MRNRVVTPTCRVDIKNKYSHKLRPNQALPPSKTVGKQADGMSMRAIYMAKHGSGANDKTFDMGLVSLVA